MPGFRVTPFVAHLQKEKRGDEDRHRGPVFPHNRLNEQAWIYGSLFRRNENKNIGLSDCVPAPL